MKQKFLLISRIGYKRKLGNKTKEQIFFHVNLKTKFFLNYILVYMKI